MSNQLTLSVVLKLVDQMSGQISGVLEENGKKLESFGERAQRVGQKFEAFGARATVAGAALGYGVKQAVSAFSELEDAEAILKSTMLSADGLSKNFGAVRDLAVQLGNTLPGNTADFARMISTLLQLGVSEEAVLGGVGAAAANLAVVMKLPYEQAAEIAAKLKEATGTSEKDMLRFMDTIQRVGHQGVQSGEMMYAFARSGGALKQFGIQGEEQARKVAAIYAQLIKAGASGETVGTGFASILNSLLKFDNQGTKSVIAAKEMLDGLGVSIDFFDDKTGQFKGIDNMVAQLDKLKGLNQSQLGEVLQKIFGGGQDQQFAALLAQGGVTANQAMQQDMAGQADIGTRVGVQLETLSAKWEAATGTFQNFLAKLGETIAPKLGEIVDWFGRVSEAGQKFVDENPELASWLGLAAAGTAATLTVAGAAALAIGGSLSMIGTALGAIGTAWGAAAAAFTAISTFATVMASAAGAAAIAAAGTALAAIAGVVAAWKVGFAFGTWINDQINLALEALTGEKGATLGGKLYDWIEGPGGLIPTLKSLPGKLKATVAAWVQIGRDLINGLWEGIKAEIRKPIEAIKDMARELPDWAKKLLGIKSPSLVFKKIGENVGEGLALGIENSLPDVQAAADKMIEVVTVNPAAQPRNSDGSFKSFADAASQGTGMLGGFREYAASVQSMADQTKNMVVRSFKSMEDALTQFVRTGKWDFRSLTDSILSDLARMASSQFTSALSGLFGGNGGSTGGFGGIDGLISSALSWLFSANGNAFHQGKLLPFAAGGAFTNKVVSGATLFPLGMMGEAGPEAILPLARLGNGKLGVQSAGGGASVQVNIINNAQGAQATANERTDQNGNRIVDVLIEQVKGSIASDIGRGRGPIPGALASTYGLNRVAGAY